MNTPSHYILNLAFLSKTIAPKENVAITIGAILPDVPIFIFYFVAKFIYKLPENKIWSQAYYEPFWQNIIAFTHSFPVAIIGLIISMYFGWKSMSVFFISMICHSLLDIPFHNDDAHRHFFPFTDYRFISPLSYWDPNHYGKLVGFFELSLVLGVTPMVLNILNSIYTKGILILMDLFFIFIYFRFYLSFKI